MRKQFMKKLIFKTIKEFYGKPNLGLKESIYDVSDNVHAAINFGFWLEKRFNVEFTEDEWNQVETVMSCIRLIQRKLTARAGTLEADRRRHKRKPKRIYQIRKLKRKTRTIGAKTA